MNKRFSIAVIAIFLTGLVFFAQTVVNTQVNTNIQTKAFLNEDFFQNEALEAALFEELISYYGVEYMDNQGKTRDNTNMLLSLFDYRAHVIRVDEIVYPDFLGGIYYNDENYMVVQIVEDAETKDANLYSSFNSFIAEEGDILIEYVRFSYNEINAAMDELNDFYLEANRTEAMKNINFFGVDIINNRIEIHLYVYSEEEMARFRNEVLDSPIISFVEACDAIVNFNKAATVY